MATVSCKSPSAGACSFISLHRQQQFTCHVECKVKAGCESLRNETSEALSVQSGLTCAKSSNITFKRHGIDDFEAIPFSENIEKGSSPMLESGAHVEKCLVSLQTCLLTLPDASSYQNGNLQSMAVSETNNATAFDFKLDSGGDDSFRDFTRHKDLKHHETKQSNTDSVALPDHQDSIHLVETDISGRLNASEINNRSSTSTVVNHPKGAGEVSRQPQPLVLQSLLSPLRCLKRWIVNSLRRAFMSLKEEKSFTHNSNDGLIDNNTSEVCESSRHLQQSTDKTQHTMSIDQQNGSTEFPWEFLKKFLESPYFVKFRVSISMANLTMTVSTFLSKALPVLSDFKKRSILRGISVSVAPTFLGGRIVLDAAISNLTFVISRLMIHLAIVWVLWSLKHVTRAMIGTLQKCGAVEKPVVNNLVLSVEVAFGATAALAILSSIAASNPSIATPSLVALALAGKDVLRDYFAGFFLLAAQPIQPGYIVSIPCYSTGSGPFAVISSLDGECRSGWFEGVCESVGLTYTVLRNAQCQIRIPNSMFLRREFLVVDKSQAHVSEDCSPMPVKDLELVTNSMDCTAKHPRHISFSKDTWESFAIGKSNLTSIGNKLFAYGPTNCTSS